MIRRAEQLGDRAAAAASPAGRALADSPRMVAQREQIRQSFGPAAGDIGGYDDEVAAPVVQRVGNKAYDILVSDEEEDHDDEEAHDEHEWGEREEAESSGSSDKPLSYLDAVEDSLEHKMPLAFVVNAILSMGEVGNLVDVVSAMVAGLDIDEYGDRVAVVLGINAPEGRDEELDAAMRSALVLAQRFPFPIGLVRCTWRGRSFPYGQMRNAVLASEEVTAISRAFIGCGYHPYVSVQDFDTGSRRVAPGPGKRQGPHVFAAVEARLRGRARPLMVGGGYRPGPGAELVRQTRARLKKVIDEAIKDAEDDDEVAGLREEQADIERRLADPDFASDFTDHVTHDMASRQVLAQVHPLLPYTPEPNLFLDAMPLLFAGDIGAEAPRFGHGAAEYTELAKTLSGLERDEMLHSYQSMHESAGEDVPVGKSVPSASREFDVDQVLGEVEKPPSPTAMDKSEVHSRLSADLQSGRHPSRGANYLVDYPGLAVETDLSRLALTYLRTGKDPQSHIGLTTPADRFFQDKSAKKGTSMATLPAFLGKRADPEEPLPGFDMEDPTQKWLARTHSAMQELGDPASKLSKSSKMPFRKNNEISGALSSSLGDDGPFEGLSTGIQPNQKALAFGLAAMGAELATQRFSLLLKALLDRRSRGTPLDGNCLYHAVHQVRSGGPPDNGAAGLLRQQAVDWALDDANLPTVASYAFSHGVSLDALIDTLSRSGAWGGTAGDLAPRILASALGVRIVIVLGDLHREVVVPPLGGGGGGPLRIELRGSHYSVPVPLLQPSASLPDLL